VALFLKFVGKHVAKRVINVSEEMLQQVITHLTQGEGRNEDAAEREQIMLDLVIAHPSLLDQSLLNHLESARPYALCAHLPSLAPPFAVPLTSQHDMALSYAVSEIWYRKTNDYNNIIKCYLYHPIRKVVPPPRG